MRFFWKIILLIIPFGGYWLYRKNSDLSGESEVQLEQKEEDKTTPESPSQNEATEEQGEIDAEDQLTKIEGVTSRVAENLIKEGIQTKEDLTKLSREELMEIKGIGPKRAEKILNLG